MGKILITIEDKTEDRLRKLVAKKWGDNPKQIRRGVLSLVFEEAIRDWMEKQQMMDNLRISNLKKDYRDKNNLQKL